jgi:7-cyano-7-deazaguanine synthase
MINSVVVVSGGLDSVTLLHHIVKGLNESVAVISFDYGQRHALRELEYANYNTTLLSGVKEHKIVDFKEIANFTFGNSALTSNIEVPKIETVLGDPQPITYVPNRNMIFLSIALGYAESLGAKKVYYGAQKHDIYGYWDTTLEFLEAINSVVSLNRKNRIVIEAPFVDFSKGQIVKRGLELEVDYSKTWSCYNGRLFACGICSTCVERLKAFSDNNIIDPLIYEI